MPKANEIKKGDAISYNDKLLLVKDIEVQSPSARGASTLYKMRFTDVKSGLKVEQRFKGDDVLETIELMRRPVSFSYVDGDEYLFMDDEDFSSYSFNQHQIEDELLFIHKDGIKGMHVLTVDDTVIALELPQTVELDIVETAPGIKGASASARSKPATLSTGLTIQVPEYIENGERIKIHVAERRYMSRAD